MFHDISLLKCQSFRGVRYISMQLSLSKEASLCMLTVALSFIFTQYYVTLVSSQRSRNISFAVVNRRQKVRYTWSQVNERISNSHFCQMFHMSRDCFTVLCKQIICSVGESKFKLEEYISAFLKHPRHTSMSRQS